MNHNVLTPHARQIIQIGMISHLLLGIFLFADAASCFQAKGGRGGGNTPGPTTTSEPKSGSPRGSETRGIVKGPNKLTRADLKIIATSDCQIWLNGQEVPYREHRTGLLLKGQKIKIEYTQDAGSFILKGLKPDSYAITAREPYHLEYSGPVLVALQQQNVVTIALAPIPGNLSVSPSVSGTMIEVINLETNIRSGPYTNPLNRAEFTPGRYRIAISKEGYSATTREIILNPGESVYLEPQLEPLPTPTPTPTPLPRSTVAAMPLRANVEAQSKDLIVRLQGASGEASSTVGSVNVTMSGRTVTGVSGLLNGLPCRVQFIRLENVSEGSLVETPGPSNQWSLLVVRISPKDSKRPIRFAINWQSLSLSSTSTDPVTGSFIEAAVIKKVVPSFPPAARQSGAFGTVNVSCVVDSQGTVTSAKAIDGPVILRSAAEEAALKWKFRPATRDGRPVESTISIRFNFEKQ